MEYNKHINRLEEIYTKDCIQQSKQLNSNMETSKKLKTIKRIHNRYKDLKQNNTLCRQNDQMFEKLKSISSGNYKSGVPREPPFMKKSLVNGKKRIDEIKRQTENYKMRVRINKITSVPSIKRDGVLRYQDSLLEKQHKIHNQYYDTQHGGSTFISCNNSRTS